MKTRIIKGPTITELATIAAPLMQRHKGNHKKALAEAQNLWLAAVIPAEKMEHVYDIVGCGGPSKFPITRDDMMALVIPHTMKVHDAVARLRDFCKAMDHPERVAAWQNKGVSEKEYWETLRDYPKWWNNRLSKQRSVAGKNGASRKHGKKGVDME